MAYAPLCDEHGALAIGVDRRMGAVRFRLRLTSEHAINTTNEHATRMTTAAAEPEYLDEAAAQQADLPTVVSWLARQVGGRTVAVVGGVRSTRQVGEWMRGEREPRGADTTRRLRLAARLTSIIMDPAGGTAWDGAAAFAWLTGSNRLLDDESPLVLIATGKLDEPLERGDSGMRAGSLQKALVTAARSFAALTG